MKNELYHHGIFGMKWGVRRFQNEDGTLTPAGKERYAKQAYREARRDYVKLYNKGYMFNSKSKFAKKQMAKIKARRQKDPVYRQYSVQNKTRKSAIVQSTLTFPARVTLRTLALSAAAINSTKLGRTFTKGMIRVGVKRAMNSGAVLKGAKFMQDIIRKASDMRGDYTVATEIPKMLSR